MNHDQANEALGAISSANKSVAAVSAAPLWRHVAFALTLAAIVACTALPAPYRFTLLALVFAAIAGLVQWDRRATGMFVNGYRAGRTLPLSIALLVAILALIFLTLRLKELHGPYVALLPVPAAFGIALTASLWWERIFLRELRSGR